MRVRITIFTSIIQAILFAVHWFVYATWMSFRGAAKTPGVTAAKIILVLLSVSFVITSLLAFRYSNMLIRIFYTISAVWLGMLSFFFLAASLSWFTRTATMLLGLPQRFRKAPSALEYAADLTPVVAAKEARASWNARGMAETA